MGARKHQIIIVLLGSLYLIFYGIHCQPGFPYYQYGIPIRPSVIPVEPFPIAEIAVFGVVALVIGLLVGNQKDDNQAGPQCPDNLVGYRDSCYFIVQENGTASETDMGCIHRGAGLVNFETMEEMNFLADKIEELGLDTESGVGTTFFTNGADNSQGPGFIWVGQGTEISPDLFGTGQPASSSGCVILSFVQPVNGMLATGVCDEDRYYICEMDNPLS